MLTRCGDDAFSVAAGSPQEAQALAAQLRRSGDWLDVVPGIGSVLLRFDATRYNADEVGRTIASVLEEGTAALRVSDTLVEIPVVYGGDHGPDLDELARATGLSGDEIVALHTGSEYRVDMIGFTPGFAFVGGLDERLRVPRRTEPRQRVEAGSIGIADARTGIYAMASPGGWTLIGRTPRKLFDPAAANPFVLEPGMRVRFVAIGPGEFDA
ncbi:MAG: 5-oxoprolinase subunit PxpB [Proteobacteria bacterium]|nr:5-oxoprolinase subunit PxpB [Pseudomonadota bacterium]